MADIDLDAIAREVGESDESEALTVTFKGQTFQLLPPAEISMFDIGETLRTVEALKDEADANDPAAQLAALDAINAFLKLLFVEEDWRRFVAMKPGPRLIGALVAKLPSLYGMAGLGEAPASSGSAEPTGDGSRPTSNGSTPSTPETSSDEAAAAPV
jgi:hypothetical protein